VVFGVDDRKFIFQSLAGAHAVRGSIWAEAQSANLPRRLNNASTATRQKQATDWG
jgi:hypothetical protein